MYLDQLKEEELHIKDVVYGTVIGRCSKGIFLMLENGWQAFSPFSPLPCGTKVLCSVIKKPTDELRALVAVDSVFRELIEAA